MSDSTDSAQLERNKAVVRRYFGEVLDRQRFDILPELMREDAVLHRPGFDVVGVDAAAARLRATFRDYVAFESRVAGVVAEGDMVCVRIEHRTRVKPHTFRSRAGEIAVNDVRDLNWTAIVQFRFVEGRIAEEWVNRDELGMLLQLGKVSAQSSRTPAD